MSGQIAEFWASLGFKIAPDEIKKVDKFLGDTEKKLKRVNKERSANAKSGQTVNQWLSAELKAKNALNRTEKESTKAINEKTKAVNKLTAAETKRIRKGLMPEISALGRIGMRSASFKPTGWAMSTFDTRLDNLQRSARAARDTRSRAGFMAGVNTRLSYLAGPSKSDELKSMANFYRQQERFAREELKLKKQGLRTEQQVERTRRQGMITERARNFQNRLSGAMSGAGGGGTTTLGSGGRNAASYGRANYLHAGGATGAFMRYGAGSLPFIGGMYGIGSLNRANQNLVSTEIAAASIFGDRANDAKSWLEQHSDYVGYNYLESMPIFSSFMASGMPLMGYETSRGVFESLTEFGRTRGADSVSMKRAMTAIQQMAAKGQVMQEELKLQLSEAKGFGESRQIFAEAWQIKTGGNLTGAPAAAALLEAMQRGEVKSADLLPIVAMLMKELASGGIEKARQSSIAEQARVSNAGTKALRIFSENGGEKGFARLWKAMTIAMMEATPYVESAGKAFNEISRVLSRIILIPQSFKRAFEGRDSLMMDIFGAEGISQIKDFVQILKESWDELKTTFGIVGEGWKLIIEEFGSGIIGFVGKIIEIFKYTLQAINRIATGNASGASDSLAAIRTVLGGGSSEDAYKVSQGVEVNIPSRRDLSPEDLMFRAAQRLSSLPRPDGVIENIAYARQALIPKMELAGAFDDLVRGNPNSLYYNDPHGVLDMLNTRLRTEGGSNSQVVFQNGSIVITTAATDAEGIARELTPMLERELQNMVITE